MTPVELEAVTRIVYTSSETQGVIALVVAGIVSLLAIIILAGFMTVKALRSWNSGGGILPQTHVAPYFASLLLANFFQAIGSIISLRWIKIGATQYDSTCVGQGVMKNVGDVGTSLWSLVIAFHAFDVLFLRRKQMRVTLWATFIGTWAFIFFIDLIGPVFLEKSEQGPFFGVSGYWCWITSNYPRSRVFLEYIFMFMSAVLCGLLHSVVFLRLRGNLSGKDWRNIKFRRIPRSERWALKIARDEVDGRMYKVAMQLMWYPLIYILSIIPIAVTRFVDFAGHDVPFALTISADFIFNLGGLLNVLLFGVTYHRIPVTYLPTLAAPRKSLYITNYGITPFVFNPAEEPKSETNADVDIEKGVEDMKLEAQGDGDSRRNSVTTVNSVVSDESTAPLTRAAHRV